MAAVAAGALQVGQHHATLVLLAVWIVKAREHPADVLVSFVVPFSIRTPLKLTSGAPLRKSCSCAIVPSLVSFMLITILE